MLARLGHGEIILHAEQNGIHVHDLFQDIDLEWLSLPPLTATAQS